MTNVIVATVRTVAIYAVSTFWVSDTHLKPSSRSPYLPFENGRGILGHTLIILVYDEIISKDNVRGSIKTVGNSKMTLQLVEPIAPIIYSVQNSGSSFSFPQKKC